jgi:hypothetical protein
MSTQEKTTSLSRRKLLLGAIALLVVIVVLVVVDRCRPADAPCPVRQAANRVIKRGPTPTVPPEEKQITAVERAARQEEAQEALRQIIDEQQAALAEAEAERKTEIARIDQDERRRREDENARRINEERRAHRLKLEKERVRKENERVRLAEEAGRREAEERAKQDAIQAQREAEAKAKLEAEIQATEQSEPEIDTWDTNDDDTPDVETETTVSMGLAKKGWTISGDLRPIMDGLHEESRDGSTQSDAAPGLRARIGADFGITKRLHVGTRIAGTGFVGSFNPNFILPGNLPDNSELESGTFGFDQLYFSWAGGERFNLAVGRLQTRFQLRGGVYAKSLDRNNSHNWRVNWTDGLQATLKTGDWRTSFVLQLNPRSRPTGVRRDPLDFDHDDARRTYFLAFENFEKKGVLVQRAFDINYLPASLLKDGDPGGRRTDYWGFVGRLMFVWPPGKEGLRLRAGPEIGYAPETPTYEAVGLAGTGDVSGFAWNVVISAVDFKPGHSIGLNYARTGAGWLLAPQYRPNHELIEIRHMWRSKKFPLLETRIRRRTELQQQIGTVRPRTQYDFFIRLTYRFTLLEE